MLAVELKNHLPAHAPLPEGERGGADNFKKNAVGERHDAKSGFVKE
jgi:hypothetical protein